MENGLNSSRIRYLDTTQAYDLWAKVYDTDGNFLQALDTIEMKTLLPRLLSLVEKESTRPWRLVDLGCGTGRNTVALLSVNDADVVGLDLSANMLDVARRRLNEERDRIKSLVQIHLQTFDMISTPSVPEMACNADAIISTLVIEHIPLDVYFSTAAKMLRTGGHLLVTNMHSEMGAISQAGFIDPETGEKIRPTSYAHTIEDVLAEAKRQGFDAIGDIEERQVDADIAPRLGHRAEKWIGVTVWFGGIFRRSSDGW